MSAPSIQSIPDVNRVLTPPATGSPRPLAGFLGAGGRVGGVMAGICAVLALVGACIALAFGVVRLFPAYRRYADLAATRPIRDAAFVAQALVEVRRG